MNIVILGAGNVANHLGKAFTGAGHHIVSVFSRNQKRAKELAKSTGASFYSDLSKITYNADLYLITVSDGAIEEIAKKLGECRNKASGNLLPAFPLVAHTSGSVPMKALAPASKNIGVIYPLQTFSKGFLINIKTTPFCIEANNKRNEIVLANLARSVSDSVHFINSKKRMQLHLAAVFANNFTNNLYAVAEEILKNAGLSFELLLPLIRATAQKVETKSPREAQTGPAKRGEMKVIEEHLKLLRKNKNQEKLYKVLSESICSLFSVKFHKCAS